MRDSQTQTREGKGRRERNVLVRVVADVGLVERRVPHLVRDEHFVREGPPRAVVDWGRLAALHHCHLRVWFTMHAMWDMERRESGGGGSAQSAQTVP